MEKPGGGNGEDERRGEKEKIGNKFAQVKEELRYVFKKPAPLIGKYFNF